MKLVQSLVLLIVFYAVDTLSNYEYIDEFYEYHTNVSIHTSKSKLTDPQR